MQSLQVCRNPGRICTNRCPHRTACKIPRIPWLIPCIVVQYRKRIVYPDEYPNELAIRKVELLSDVEETLREKLNYSDASKIKINSV